MKAMVENFAQSNHFNSIQIVENQNFANLEINLSFCTLLKIFLANEKVVSELKLSFAPFFKFVHNLEFLHNFKILIKLEGGLEKMAGTHLN